MKKSFKANSRYVDGFRYLKNTPMITPRLVIRSLKESDSDKYLGFVQEDEKAYLKFIEWDNAYLPMTQAWARSMTTALRQAWGLEATMFIFEKGSQELMGSIFAFRNMQSDICIGYFLSAKYRKKGYMQEAVRALTDRIRKNEHDAPIFAEVVPGIKSSISVLRSSGFNCEGRWLSKHPTESRAERVLTFRLV